MEGNGVRETSRDNQICWMKTYRPRGNTAANAEEKKKREQTRKDEGEKRVKYEDGGGEFVLEN
ncbi:hypothetical protein EYF80_022583 [Liparis tanakae]|uniref:Uncharacterized protein n=1 Tax=Liparis tanakae TaxID=230148 RepID=A0A4Z2HMT9_9TELE|nr:hypothetical protein EYF80_022583 [Liparis tanakae]